MKSVTILRKEIFLHGLHERFDISAISPMPGAAVALTGLLRAEAERDGEVRPAAAQIYVPQGPACLIKEIQHDPSL